MDDLGVSTCARRELMEELSLESPGHEKASTPTSRAITPATVQLFQGATLEQLGVLNDDSSEVGRRHVAVVYRAWLPDWSVASRLAKGDSSIRRLNWLDVARDKVDLSEFEYWSQLCLRRFFPSNVISEAGIRILHPTRLKRRGALVVSGRIGSGKSETATYLATRLGTRVIRSSEILQQLMGTRPLQEIGRKEFQDRAHQFISQVDGPAKLAACIAEAVARAEHDRCIVDGIRHLATYEHLRMALSDTTSLAYLQTPPDIAFDLYRSREATADLNFTYRDFLRFYDAPVESEISSLGRAADVYIYNSFGLEAFRRTLNEIVELLQENAE
jgi:cytidylate kinase